MHNKYATFVLPIVAGLAIVGAGFSTWVFGNTSTTPATASGSVTITGVDSETMPMVSVKTGTVHSDSLIEWSSFSVGLDQGGVENATNTSAGISVSGATLENADYTEIDFEWSLPSDTHTSWSNYDVQIFYEVTSPTYEWIKLDDDSAKSNSRKGYVSAVDGTVVTSDNPAANATKINVSTITGDSILVNANINNDWIYSTKPQTESQYDSMTSYFLNNDSLGTVSDGTRVSQITLTLAVTTVFTLRTNG